jgi:hypothetical protein
MRAWIGAIGVCGMACTPGGDPTETDTGTPPPVTAPTTGPTDPDGDGDGVPASSDCDDQDPAVHPGALERCDGIDNDCDLGVDDQAAATLDLGGAVTNHATVDEAFAAAGLGAVVDVCPGVWPVAATLTLIDGDLTIRGVAGRDATTLQGVDYGTAIRLRGATSLAISGVTITDGGVAVRVEDTSTLALTDSRMAQNVGAMMIQGDAPGPTVTIARTELVDNTAGSGLGGAIQGFGVFTLGVTDSVFSGNHAGVGGAMALGNIGGAATVTLERTTLSGNTAERDAGAMLVEQATVTLVETVISGNTAAGSGGGLVAYTSSVAGDGLSSIEGNTATLERGGGLVAYRSSIADLVVSGNDAPLGGGVAVGFDWDHQDRPQTTLVGVVVDGNTADFGAGVLVEQGEAPSVDGVAVTSNVAATAGGGAWIEAGAALTSTSSDWGSPDLGNDNAPDDVATGGAGAFSFGAGADFACDGSTGCP